VHLDVNVVGRDEVPVDERKRRLQSAADELVNLGAKVIRPVPEESEEYWVVLQDPEGNEFCVQ
jgi:predicted enzyme related to lactoylglutathione lyase